jgi:hypothetical protein
VKIKKLFKAVLSSQKSLAFVFVGLFGIIGIVTLLYSHADSTTASLSLSQSSQTVTTGSDITVTLVLNPDGNSINTVQSVLSYPSANFNFVSAVAGSSLGNFIYTKNTGSVTITAASTTPVSGTSPVTVAVITLASNSIGNNLALSLASVCPSGNYALTCSAVYDSVNDNNDLASVGSSAIYTVNAQPPSAPTNFKSTAVTTSATTLSWTTSTDTGGTLGGYYLYRYPTSDGTNPLPDDIVKVATIPTYDTSYTDSNLIPGTSYNYYLEAYDTSTPVEVSLSTPDITVTTTALPTAPTNLSKTASTTTSISLGWTASTDTGGPGLGGYYLYRYPTSDGTNPLPDDIVKIATLPPSATSYTDSNLNPGTSVSYYLEAFDTALVPDVSASSSTLNASTALNVVPSTPTGLTKDSSSAYTISLGWTASTDTGGPGLGGYYLFRNGTKIATLTASTTTYMDIGLSINTAYSYYVQAFETGLSPSLSATSIPASISTSSIIGDLDGDNQVTGHDLSIALSEYGKNYPPAEFDGGSIVEGHDISMLLTNYGK